MAKFTFQIDTGHAPMRSTEEIAKAMRVTADLLEPWGTLFSKGRAVTDSDGKRMGVFTYEDES